MPLDKNGNWVTQAQYERLNRTPEQKKAEADTELWGQIGKTRNARKIVDGVDPALKNVKEPNFAQQVADVAFNRVPSALAGAVTESELARQQGVSEWSPEGFMAGLRGFKRGITGDADYNFAQWLEAEGMKEGTAREMIGGTLDVLANPIVPGLLKGGGKVAGKVLQGELGKRALGTGLGGGAYESGVAYGEGDSAGEALKKGAEGAAYWGGTDLGLGLIGKGVSKIAGKLGKGATKEVPVTEEDIIPERPTEWIVDEPAATSPIEEIITLGKGATKESTINPFTDFEVGLNEPSMVEKPINISEVDATLPESAQQRYYRLIAEEIKRLKDESGLGVMQGGLKRDAEGNTLGAWGRKSLNPEWYQELFLNNASEKYPAGRKPTTQQLKDLAIKNLSEGTRSLEGKDLPANLEFLRLGKEIESGRTLPKEWEALEESIQQMQKDYNPELEPLIRQMRQEQENLLKPSYSVDIADNAKFKYATSTAKKAVNEANATLDVPHDATDKIVYDESAMGREDIQLADKVANALSGTSVIPVKMPSFMGKVQGFFEQSNKKIFLNKDMEDPATYVTLHEVGHRMEVTHPEHYYKMLDVAVNNLKDDHKALIQRYQKRGYGVDEMPEEYFNDLMAEMLHDKSFVGKLRDKAPEVIQPLLQVLDEVIAKVKLALSKDDSVLPFIENLERLRNELAPEYKSYMETVAEQQGKSIRKGWQTPEGIAAKQGLGKGATTPAIQQAISSADTSLNQIASTFRSKYFTPGKTNIDIGGGKYNKGTDFLRDNYGTENLVLDPFNRDFSNNSQIAQGIKSGNKGDTVTVNNVLNVIAEPEVRQNVIKQAAKSVKEGGNSYFLIYEGNGTGIGKETVKGWQNNRRTQDYVNEVKQYFEQAERKGNLIIARNPINIESPATWMLDSNKNIRFKLSGTPDHAENAKSLILAGASKINAGTKYGTWAKEMVAEHGQGIEKNLPYIWHGAQDILTQGKTTLKIGGQEIPVKNELLDNGQKVRSLGVSGVDAEFTSPEVKRGLIDEMVPGGRGAYDPITNKATLEQAKQLLTDDADVVARRIFSDEEANAVDNAAGMLLVKQASDAGNHALAVDLTEAMAKKATQQGQSIQALSMWGRLTPEGMLRYAQKVVDQANKVGGKKGKVPTFKVTPETAGKIKGMMDELEGMPEGREKAVKTAQVLKIIGEQVPPNILQKIATFQTMAQLLNLKTATRNIVGNAGFGVGELAGDVVGTGVDKVLSKFTGERTQILPSLRTQLKGGKQGWQEGYEDAMLGINTGPVQNGKFELSSTPVFRENADSVIERGLAKAEKVLNIELRASDRAFYKAAYEDEMRKQVELAKMNGRKLDFDSADEMSRYTALRRTFQDDNVVSDGFSKLKRILNGGKDFGIGDFVIKYPKTPANLLVRGLEYSPAGFVNTIFEASKPLMGRGFNQKAFVDSFSRALVGTTGLVGMGALLHKLGIVSGKPDADWDLERLKEQVGLGSYKVNASALKRFVLSGLDPDEAKLRKNDLLINYDWFQPFAIGIALGADIDANNADVTGVAGTLMNALATGINTFAEQPIMQGIQTVTSGGSKDLASGIVKTMQGVPASFVPTLLSQVRQIVDSQARTTYDPNAVTEAVNKAISKVPILNERLPQSYDSLGKAKTTYQNVDALTSNRNPWNVFISPAFQNRYKPTPESEMVLEIYNNTGETSQVPRMIGKYFNIKGKRIDLTAEEYSEMQRIVGEETQKGFAKIPDGYSDDKKIKMMGDVLTAAGRAGKKYVLENRGVRYNAKNGKVNEGDLETKIAK